jgi:outer membrane protein TolC
MNEMKLINATFINLLRHMQRSVLRVCHLCIATKWTAAFCLLLLFATHCIQAQQTAMTTDTLAFNTAIDLALRNSESVQVAQANLEKTESLLAQAHDVYIPTLTGGSDLGYSYGFPVGTPTIFSFSAGSLIFDYSQRDYIRSAVSSVKASELSLQEAKQQVIEDAAFTYIQLDTALQQQQALDDQYAAAMRLADIVEQREAAGLESHAEVLRAQLSQAQIHLKQLHGHNNVASLRDHMARLTGLPSISLATETASIPTMPEVPPALDSLPQDPEVQAAYAQARAAQETAFGDSRKLWHPEVSFEAGYNRFASFNNYEDYYKNFQSSNFGIGMHITLPVFDASQRARARQSAAEAVRAQRQADLLRNQAAEGDFKLINSLQEDSAKLEISRLQSELSTEQLKTVMMQLQSGGSTGNPNTPPLTPKDEQTARIDERQRFVDLLDSQLDMTHLQLDLLRASGGIEGWAQSGTETVSPTK